MFLIFAGQRFYPRGGVADWAGAAPDLEGAHRLIRWENAPKPGWVYEPGKFETRKHIWRNPDPDAAGTSDDLRVCAKDIRFSVRNREGCDWYQIVDASAVPAYSDYAQPRVVEAYASDEAQALFNLYLFDKASIRFLTPVDLWPAVVPKPEEGAAWPLTGP